MRYDVDRLKAAADCYSVARYIGIPIKRSGSTTFIECPNPDHHETRFEHCAISRDGRFCHCYSGKCLKSYDVIGMVKSYSEKQGRELSFLEACGIVGDSCGGREFYELSEEGHRAPSFEFSEEETALIGFAPDLKTAKEAALKKRDFFKVLLDGCLEETKRQQALKEIWRVNYLILKRLAKRIEKTGA